MTRMSISFAPAGLDTFTTNGKMKFRCGGCFPGSSEGSSRAGATGVRRAPARMGTKPDRRRDEPAMQAQILKLKAGCDGILKIGGKLWDRHQRTAANFQANGVGACELALKPLITGHIWMSRDRTFDRTGSVSLQPRQGRVSECRVLVHQLADELAPTDGPGLSGGLRMTLLTTVNSRPALPSNMSAHCFESQCPSVSTSSPNSSGKWGSQRGVT